MSDIPILTRIMTVYSESSVLINCISSSAEMQGPLMEEAFASIIDNMTTLVDDIVNNQAYEYVKPVEKLINYLERIVKSMPGFDKIENSVVQASVRTWIEKGLSSDNEECKEMLILFKKLLLILMP